MASTNASPPADPLLAAGRHRGARRSVSLLLALCLAACAAPAPVSPRIDRLPADAPALPAPPSSAANAPLTTGEIVRMARAGASPETVVARWRADGARLKLDVADLLDLHRRGVSVAILDALLAAREAALRTDADSRLAGLQARHEAEIAAERARPQVCPSPVWRPYPIHPYGSWRSPGGWWGGLYWGW